MYLYSYDRSIKGDGEYVCAGSARQHALYIWEKSGGNLVKILHGTKGEMLLDVVWHPVRPIGMSLNCHFYHFEITERGLSF